MEVKEGCMGLRTSRKFIVLVIVLGFALGIFIWAKGQYVVPVIMYHRIDDKAAVDKLSVSPESFRRQMSFLKRHRYNVLRLEELPGLIRDGRLPRKTIGVTFDDGREDNYINAYPVLKELRIPATIFIVPALIGQEGYLTWSQVVEMSQSGIISIGSHSMTHAYLPDLAEQKLDMEIYDSRRAIESHTGKRVYSFSYPTGGFDEDVREKVIKSGYKIAVATNPGINYPSHDIFAMKRLRISRTSDSLFVFWIETSGFYTWVKEHRDED